MRIKFLTSLVAAAFALAFTPVRAADTAPAKLYPINMSALVPIASAASLTVGFVIASDTPNSNTAKVKLLVRAIGPGLVKFGTGSATTDPVLTVNAADLVTVDNWSDNAGNTAACEAAAAASGAFALDRGTKDAATVVEVSPGALTVSIKNNGTSGDILVEVYRVP